MAVMEMQQIRYFLALCDELNFTRAAARSRVTQPSLTRAIKMLEEELGGPLFHRERANTHLSELGRTVKPYLEQVYREAENAKRQAREFARLQQTPVRLGLMCTIAPNQMLDDWILAMAAAGLGLAFMPRLCVNHPGVMARPLVMPEFWRDVALVTVRGRPHSPAVGALVAEAMRVRWADAPALAVQATRDRRDAGADPDNAPAC